ncbi:MAG: hypothetical protein HZC37_07900 [Burkholderiales bacterium]|nr:hypothetical protein [Burkholderiales bacterium]
MNNEEAVLVRSAVVRRAGAGLRVRAQALAIALAAFAAAQAQAQDWVISVLEGEAVVVDGLRRVTATAGQRLEPGAIVETSPKTLLLRIEGADQSTYDLGPEARAMLAPAGFPAKNERAPQIYLLHGWLKGTARGPREAAGIVTPALEVLPFKGSVVLHQMKREHVAFVESGRVDLVERRLGSGSIAVNAGEFYGGEGARRGSVAARPAPSWLQTVPRSFRDPIPLRAAAFRDKRIEPVPLPGPTYAQLADWLTAEMTLRVQMPARFAPLVRDAAFRAEIASHLPVHPEWGPIINPPEPRPRRTTTGASR